MVLCPCSDGEAQVARWPGQALVATRGWPRPLIVYAIGVSGPTLSNLKTDVVVSDEDAYCGTRRPV